MRIAQIAPLIERVPPKKYGGTERVVFALTEELVKRGHEVTLFASGDSTSTAKLHSVCPRSLREVKLNHRASVCWSLLNVGMAYSLQNEFDIIHDHMVPLSLPTANLSETPVVATMHGAFNPQNRKLFQNMMRPRIVTISESQMYVIPSINHAGTVHNGLPMEHYPFGEKPEDFLLFVGRIAMDKGVHLAIDVALQLDMTLIIAAKLDDADISYFKDYIEPRLSERIRWIGEVNEEERNSLMSRARCFLHPAAWREPFGLTLIEAMACGAPVVAFNRGSIPEVIKTGVTGYVVEDIEGMVEAVANIGKIDRSACREHSLQNFNEKKMADGYEAVYKKILDGTRTDAIKTNALQSA